MLLQQLLLGFFLHFSIFTSSSSGSEILCFLKTFVNFLTFSSIFSFPNLCLGRFFSWNDDSRVYWKSRFKNFWEGSWRWFPCFWSYTKVTQSLFYKFELESPHYSELGQQVISYFPIGFLNCQLENYIQIKLM